MRMIAALLALTLAGCATQRAGDFTPAETQAIIKTLGPLAAQKGK